VTSFNFFDLANSKFEITVEAVDAENGATVQCGSKGKTEKVDTWSRIAICSRCWSWWCCERCSSGNDPWICVHTDPRFEVLRTQIVVTAAEALTLLDLPKPRLMVEMFLNSG
jgi:hypothetical protein